MDVGFYSALIIFTVTVLSPGPALLAILSTGITSGRTHALALTAGILSGSATWGLVTLFGFVAVLESLGSFFFLLKIAGGLYLLHLAWKSARVAWSTNAPAAKAYSGSLKKTFFAGLIIHLTNPKAVFGWAATIAIGVNAQSNFGDAAFLVIVCMAIVITLKTAMAMMFSTQAAIAFYSRIRRRFQAFLAVLFGLAGLRLLSTAT